MLLSNYDRGDELYGSVVINEPNCTNRPGEGMVEGYFTGWPRVEQISFFYHFFFSDPFEVVSQKKLLTKHFSVYDPMGKAVRKFATTI